MAPFRFLSIAPIFLLSILLLAEGVAGLSSDTIYPDPSTLSNKTLLEKMYDKLVEIYDGLSGLVDDVADLPNKIIDGIFTFIETIIMIPLRFLEKVAEGYSNLLDMILEGIVGDDSTNPATTSFNLIKAFASLLIILLVGRIYVLVLDYLPVA